MSNAYLMRKYPIEEIEEISYKLQQYLASYRIEQDKVSRDFYANPDKKGSEFFDSSTKFMNNANMEMLPRINKVIGQIEALITVEDVVIAERIRPILEGLYDWVKSPTNPLGYAEISGKLMNLVGHLSIELTIKPKIFVGHRYTKEDEKIADKFMELFRLEGLDCYTGKPAKSMEVDEKVQKLIIESEGVIIIFTRDMKLESSEYWTTSGWLNGELTFAIAKDKPHLMFYDDCINPGERKGIQGELEYIEFNRECLDESFLKAIPYLRDFRGNILNKIKK
jgi:hypothetical protein